jgi:hypothetical protein
LRSDRVSKEVEGHSMRILRGISSKLLPCGCLTGVYETYDAEVVSILDAKGNDCVNSTHRDGKIIPVGPPVMPRTPPSGPANRRSAQD